MSRFWLLLLLLWALPLAAQERLRLATFNTGLGRDGPGLLLKDIIDGNADILATAEIIATTAPDIILLTSFDNDYKATALTRFNGLEGLQYPYTFAPLGNAGQDSGLDINGNGYLHDWNDRWGFGRFDGSEGMVLLSRYPITASRTFDHSFWQDFGPAPLAADGTPYFKDWPALRLAAHSLWDIEITLPSGPFHILAAHPTPPVFDGAEDANGLRNAAEITFLLRYINGAPIADDTGTSARLADTPFALLADLNADPEAGDSRKPPLQALLASPRLQNPAALAGRPTVAWESAGNLRVDYVLPSAGLPVLAAGIFPLEGDPLIAASGSRHRLVWVDVSLAD